ncbi:type II toxin-antitoxin system HipA family toxin [Actinomyces mediterranea]|uniref:type II toxin-antitoxin system HipA family toxin n=1 Tax=Actinomyces mediterranea TaxID=1871028 RepID=UPI00097093BE|nr:type II toxin-antitoxin system HipA family toxin [Actinomyces mediterranea]
MSRCLHGYLAGTPIGTFIEDRRQISFTYDDAYCASHLSTPLSLSMPMQQRSFKGAVVANWLENLLPESEQTRRRIAQKLGIGSTSAFSLLAHIGHDLAGAIQLLPEGESPSSEGSLTPHTEASIAQRIRELHAGAGLTMHEGDVGRWSLAGQQGKFALALVNGHWMEPGGRAPSTHIFKVGITGLAYSDLAEYATMRAAQLLGLHTAPIRLEHFEDETAVIVTRYDRVITEGQVRRLHQEDFCQALGLGPERKYQSDGGPRIRDMSSLLADMSRPHEDTAELARWHAFNLVAACPDGHAKNLSIILSGRARVLAPFYDLISGLFILSETEVGHKAKLALKFGGEYRIGAVSEHHAVKAAKELGVDPHWFVTTIIDYATRLPGAFEVSIDEVELYLTAARADALRQRVARRCDDVVRRFS